MWRRPNIGSALLNGCSSRFLNLALQIVSSSNPVLVGTEIPFYQIGAEQGFLPKLVRVLTGERIELKAVKSPPCANPRSY